jgi:hypothetical protein
MEASGKDIDLVWFGQPLVVIDERQKTTLVISDGHLSPELNKLA